MVMYCCSGIMCLCNQKDSPRGVLIKSFSENMQDIYRRAPMQKFDLLKLHFRKGVYISSSKFATYFQNTFLQEHL